MSNDTPASRCGFAHHQSHQALHNMPKHLWDDEVVRIIKASKSSQRRLEGWVSELTDSIHGTQPRRRFGF